MDVGEPIREIEVIPEKIPVPVPDSEPQPARPAREPVPTKKEPVPA